MNSIKLILLLFSFLFYSFLNNSTAQWVQVSNGMGNQSVNSLAVSGNNIFAGTYQYPQPGLGVYLSTNNGTNWSQTSLNNRNVLSLAANGNNIFAGTYQYPQPGLGVYLSTNNGTNWSQTSLNNRNVLSLAANGNNIFAGTDWFPSFGVYKSTNNGTSWTQTSLNDRNVPSLAVNGNNIFAAAFDHGVYLSTNNGTNWTRTSLNYRSVGELAVNGNNIFAGTIYTPAYGVYRSTDNGATWAQTSLNNQIIGALAVSGNNVFAGTVLENGVYLSTNNGTSWIQTSLNNRDVHSLAVNGNNIFAATNVGVYISNDNGTSWTQRNEGLSHFPGALGIFNNYIFAGTGGGVYRRPLGELITPVTLCHITAIPEGFYNSVTDKLNRKDTLRAYLRNAAAPYNIVDSAKSVVDSVSFTGLFTFITGPSSSPREARNYFIVLKHRNSLETWSKSGGEPIVQGDTNLYNFTTVSSQAYGNNLVLKGSRYCIYSGDVDQDGTVDASDLSAIDNDAINFINGYVNTDVDGNNFVDASDMSIADNNGYNFVSVIRP